MGSGSIQGAGAPTMFQAMRRIISCLAEKYVGEGSFERAIRQSFLGMTYSTPQFLPVGSFIILLVVIRFDVYLF